VGGGVTQHGTCCASLAAGTISGTSKGATIIPIKGWHDTMDGFHGTFASWSAVFNTIVENIVATSKKGNSVISMSISRFCFGVPS
jgi:hypothetical protein